MQSTVRWSNQGSELNGTRSYLFSGDLGALVSGFWRFCVSFFPSRFAPARTPSEQGQYPGMCANSRDVQGGSVMIASNIPPLLKGLAVISKVQRSSIRFATSYCLAERRMPGVFKAAMERQLPDISYCLIDVHAFSSHLPAINVGPKHKRTKVCRSLSYSAQ